MLQAIASGSLDKWRSILDDFNADRGTCGNGGGLIQAWILLLGKFEKIGMIVAFKGQAALDQKT
jgi:hypothetical protein